MAKKEIYAASGIIYDPKTEKIESPIGSIPALLTNGNSKIGKGVFHFSTLPGDKEYSANINGVTYDVLGTCAGTCSGCYGMTGNYRYQSTIDSLAIRTVIARDYLAFCKMAINAQIQAESIKTIRIHATGDFFSKAYLETWIEIVKENPGVTFWTYTKETAAESAFDPFPNANIVKSNVPMIDGVKSETAGYNYGHIDYVLAMYDFLQTFGKSVYICRCGIDKNQHCTNCTACAKCDHVLFIEHSTGYKAEKDPLYNKAVEVIESQDKRFINN